MAFGRGLAGYYSLGQAGITEQYKRIGEASDKWGKILGDLAGAGVSEMMGSGVGNKKLKEEYGAYSTAEIDAERSPMDFDVWKSQNKDRIFKDLREANKAEREERKAARKIEKGYGVKKPGAGGLLQRLLPWGQSGYESGLPSPSSNDVGLSRNLQNITPGTLGYQGNISPNINPQVQAILAGMPQGQGIPMSKNFIQSNLLASPSTTSGYLTNPLGGPLGNVLNLGQQNANQNYYGNLYPGSSLYQTQD
jgi:hypothetical protein